jgi:hypothetical protein
MEITTTMPDALPSEWRDRAQYLRDYGDSNTARLWELAAKELEAALTAHGQETLTLVQAAKLSGFTADHLSASIKKGRIPNAGRDGAPRIRRSDLPTKRIGGARTTCTRGVSSSQCRP